MAEIFKFFNSAPGDERWHFASDFADYFGNVLSSGLLHVNNNPGLQVIVNTGTLQTIVATGEALIKGYSYANTLPITLTHDLPETNSDRIDRIVLRLDLRNANRYIKVFVKTGESSVNPVAPTLQRDENVFELSLAQILIKRNTASLEPARLIDERMKEDLCGIVYSLISVPTSVFQQQWDYWFSAQKGFYVQEMLDWMDEQQTVFNAWKESETTDFEEWKDEEETSFSTWLQSQKGLFDSWFATIKDILDTNAAGNLQQQIDAHKDAAMPHKFTKNNVTYRYGFEVNDNLDGLVALIEEVK
ncbi:hypothetical protein ABE042_22050 [Viridibacillus arvi]|uniref:hypothetical protein n=1 Tax=Viridibacillus arvi TaxID=263475 RepID=UPI003D2BFD92